MESAPEISRYVAADRSEVFAFLDAVHSKDFSARLQRQWDWKYDANPFNRDGQAYLLLWRDAGEIVGLLGIMPVRVCIDGTERLVGHPCDWAMRPDHRGRRMARRLLDRQRPDWPLRFSWQNELSRRLSPGMVGDNSGILPLATVVKPLAVGGLVEQATGSRLLAKLASALAHATEPLGRWLRWQTGTSDVIVGETSEFDDRFDGLWQRVRREYPVMVVRDRRYLDWRFVQRPDARYRILTATRGSDVVGYLVMRVVEQDGARRGYLVDFLVVERSTAIFSRLVTRAVVCIKRDRAQSIACRAAVAPFRRGLFRQGFVPVRERAPGYLRTYRPDVESPDRLECLFQDPANWFLTMGDGDLEMSL